MSPENDEDVTFGVVIPATNTVVERDFTDIGPKRATFHSARIPMGDGTITTDDEFEELMKHVDARVDAATERAAAVNPDHMVMGMSSETFWEGIEGNKQFENRVRTIADSSVTTGATAVEAGLATVDAHRIAILTPYQPIGDRRVRKYLEEAGFEVLDVLGLRCESATTIAEVEDTTLIDALRDLQASKPDVILQVGTNLPLLHLAAETEQWLDTPTIAINEAILWHALREVGLTEQFSWAGPLLRHH